MLCPVCQTPNPDEATRCRACGSPLEPLVSPASVESAALPPRTRLHRGAFVLEEPLGVGGFGLTYRATESGLSRTVAIKEFFPFGSTRDGLAVRPPVGVAPDDWKTSLEAFRQEALALARFNHPAIVRAYAVWAENGTAYFAMEFLRGQSLQKRLDGGKPLPVEEALDIIESIGAALERVHEAGFLHRDIKPDNILLCDGRAVLIDFGTARAFASDKTVPMTQLLTPGYAPLEQYGRRARFGPFTDVYALAATLYHALAGHAPPSATDRATGVELRPLDEQNPRVSPRLARAVEAALEISVPKRPQTVGAWLELLRDAQKPLPSLPFSPRSAPTTPDEAALNANDVMAPAPRTVAPPVAIEAPAPPRTVVPLPAPAPLPDATGSGTPGSGTPGSGMPGSGTPGSGTPGSGTPGSGTPGSGMPSSGTPGSGAFSPGMPRREPRASDVPFEPAIAPEARTPRWVVPTMVIVPLVALVLWWSYDPSRADLRQFDGRLRPILKLSQKAQAVVPTLNRSSPDAFVADVQGRALPPQQAVVTALQALSPRSDEALYSRDQLLDAERDRLNALQALSSATEEGAQSAALEQLRRADDEVETWRDDYDYLKRQHRVGD